MDAYSKIILAADTLPETFDFADMTDTDINVSKLKRLYFFFKSELDVKNPNQQTSVQRHLVRYRDGFYDYIEHKEFKSLKEWADHNRKRLGDIVYGLNRKNSNDRKRTTAYVSIKQLVQSLDWSYDDVS